MISNTEPLFIIDGIPLSEAEFMRIEASSIATIEVLKDAAATALYGSRGSGGVIVMTTKKGIDEVEKVQTRKNFDETAFFHPHLTTDKKGTVSFSFNSPEALTKWKLRLFAHNKKGVSGFYENTAVTQKELMIVPNFPRYFREKDSMTITAKISNLTGEPKNGLAMLQLFDAVTMEPIDNVSNNRYATQAINVAAKGNSFATWKIYIPENVEAIQYKIVAKAGNYSDGEENIVPVLKNTILVNESIPIWVRENTSKSFTFENLKNNTSSTLKNHQLTFEYTSNPTWLAILSLPYLMDFEYECSEQTFAKYFSNVLATELLLSNPKIKTVMDQWKNSTTPLSKLNQNDELKSILLTETPWLLDAENDEIQKKNLALLFDSEKLAAASDQLLEKLVKKQLPSGGFPWFDGADENEYITKHITIGIGHLKKLVPNSSELKKLDTIGKNTIRYLDAIFLDKNKNSGSNSKPHWKNNYNALHYLYARSFYLDLYPPSDSLQKELKHYVEEIKSNWSGFSLYEKGLAALVLKRFGEVNSAKLIVESIKQTASNQTESGMYWIENKSGWNWYQSPIETQALLIEVFDEIEKDQKSIDLMKVWLLKNKQSRHWSTTKATTTAIYSLLNFGTNWTNQEVDSKISLGNNQLLDKKINETKIESQSGYRKINFNATEIEASLATLKIENNSQVPCYGGFYWQYFESLDKIKSSQENTLMLSKELYLKNTTIAGTQLTKIDSTTVLKLGDLVTIRMIITSKETHEFIHLKDMRAAGFEPISVLSSYKYQDGLNYYMSTRDAATHFFFDTIKKGTYILEYDVRVNNTGDFSNGISTIQSMYAPEFNYNLKGIRIKIE